MAQRRQRNKKRQRKQMLRRGNISLGEAAFGFAMMAGLRLLQGFVESIPPAEKQPEKEPVKELPPATEELRYNSETNTFEN